MKRIFRNNVIKFIIGIVLLVISYGYIQNHPAEKASIFSGFEVLYQRAEVFFYQITNRDPEGLKNKFNLETTFNELISTAETEGCAQTDVLNNLRDTMTSLEKESVADLKNDMGNYTRKISEYKAIIDASCK